MDEYAEFRGGLIPSGNCVPDDDTANMSATFSEIDAGRSDERLFVLAQGACANCVQIEYCQPQSTEIATELWLRGAGLTFIAGSSISVGQHPRELDEDRPTLRFDLSVIPKGPAQAVAIIRQGYRAEQLNATGPTPEGVRTAQTAYLERLQQADPDLYDRLGQLRQSELDQGMKFIFTALFQQKDFARYTAGQNTYGKYRKNLRYDPDRIAPDIDDPIVSKYLQDTLTIHETGLSKPAAKAIHFEPEYYTALIAKYKTPDITLADFDQHIIGSRRLPVESIKQQEAATSIIRAEEPELGHTKVRQAVIHGKKTAEDIEPLVEAFASDTIPAKVVRNFALKNPGNPAAALQGFAERVHHLNSLRDGHEDIIRSSDVLRIAQANRNMDSCTQAAERFVHNIRALTEQFGEDPDIRPGDIRRFSETDNALEAVKAYKQNLATLTAAVDTDVSTSVLRRCAMAGQTSPLAAEILHTKSVLKDRFGYRAKAHPEQQPVRPELIERVVTLYPRSEASEVTENIHQLLQKGWLIFCAAETRSLQGEVPQQLEKIFTPRTQNYLTFSAALAELEPWQRLVFAQHHNLLPILYGAVSNSAQFETVLLGGITIAEGYAAHVEPALPVKPPQDRRPLSMMQLVTDANIYVAALEYDTDQPMVSQTDQLHIDGLRDTKLVVAGKVLHIHEKQYIWDYASQNADVLPWIQQRISRYYRPADQAAALQSVTGALAGGVLDILGTCPRDFRLVFAKNFYTSGINELERGAIANAMGIDRMLYDGSDLGPIIEQRLGKKHTVYIDRRSNQPEVRVLSDIFDKPTETEEAAQPAVASTKSGRPTSATATVSSHTEEVREDSYPTINGTETFLRRVREKGLMTAEEEVITAKQIEAGVLAEAALADGGFRDATPAELRRIASIGKAAVDRMISMNLLLVAKNAHKAASNSQISVDDLMQYGSLGLMRAVERFDYTKGYKFSTYATHWIKQSISRGALNERPIYVPAHISDLMRKIAHAQRQIRQESPLEEPTVAQIATIIGATDELVQKTLDTYPRTPLALSQPVAGRDREMTFGELIQDSDTPSPEETTIAAMMGSHSVLHRVLERAFSGNHRLAGRVLCMRFGIASEFLETDGSPLSTQQVTQALGLANRSTTHDYEQKALAILRHPAIRGYLAEALEA